MIWKLDASERISRWRLFRKTLDDVELEQALLLTAELWQTAPFSPYYLDPSDSSNWPDPWTLIAENYYCDVAKALGMLYTIQLSKHNLPGTIRIYYDSASRTNYSLSWFDDGKYILNMTDGEIVNIKQVPKTFALKFQHDVAGNTQS